LPNPIKNLDDRFSTISTLKASSGKEGVVKEEWPDDNNVGSLDDNNPCSLGDPLGDGNEGRVVVALCGPDLLDHDVLS